MRAVVVTGARGGIGEATANEVLSLGDRVYGTGSPYDETSRVAASCPTRWRATAEEKPDVFACLASEEASLVTGSMLDVDAGSDLVTAPAGPGSHAGSDTTSGVAGHLGACVGTR